MPNKELLKVLNEVREIIAIMKSNRDTHKNYIRLLEQALDGNHAR